MITSGKSVSDVPGTFGCYRERLSADGAALSSWDAFLSTIEDSSPAERERWQSTIRRELREDGLTFTLTPEREPDHRSEDLNPVPWIFSADQWSGIEKGVAQRARVLEAVVRDLLGPRTLIAKGILPAELIFSDDRYLRSCINLPSNMNTWLFQYAADLARGPDGQFRVLEDRTQVPSGSGYALESRTIMGRIFPKALSGLHVRRLAPYFRHMRESILTLYQGRPLEPRVVLLTPGPYSASYFEHAYLAAYLGYTLVQGNDLLVRNGALKLKTLEGLQPVDILFRQIDAEYLDPLELKRDSFLGVPGLLGAMRTGKVATMNHPGCGLLENAGLLAFLAPLCRQLLGEDLLLPSVATWWCGQPREFQHVMQNLKKLIVKPLHRKWNEPPVDGRYCTAEQLENLSRRIRSHPAGYVGQEPMSYSSLPTLVGDKIEERMGSLRSFAFAIPDGGYEVMPGALARSGGDPELGPRELLENKGVFKDVWVLGRCHEPHKSLWLEQHAGREEEWFNGVFTSRSAENLFWVGRYAERLMRQARLVRGIVEIDQGGLEEGQASADLVRMVGLLETYCGSAVSDHTKSFIRRVQSCLSGEQEPADSLKRNLSALLVAAYTVRDIWTQDSWRLLTEIEETGQACARPNTPPAGLENELDRLIEKLNAFYGLNAHGMTRESGWSMLMLGRVLESGLGLCDLMKGCLEPLDEGTVSYGMMEIALQQNENLITYRRHYRTTPNLRSVLSLMASTEINPHSLVFYLDRTHEYLNQLPPPVQPDVLEPLLQRIRKVRHGFLDKRLLEISAEGQLTFLAGVREVLEDTSVAVSSSYFSHTTLCARENF
ncbi:circularly permuted type 2 ATP-grasp protein [Kiritimatiellaeota bacterium B1221]|nr:circularly permuted type 2 ATP-grasp protein [Kiritimatiellaeota bacterium B1221]